MKFGVAKQKKSYLPLIATKIEKTDGNVKGKLFKAYDQEQEVHLQVLLSSMIGENHLVRIVGFAYLPSISKVLSADILKEIN